jgi:hypothetical protein
VFKTSIALLKASPYILWMDCIEAWKQRLTQPPFYPLFVADGEVERKTIQRRRARKRER